MSDIPKLTVVFPDIGPSYATAHFAPDATEDEIARVNEWVAAYNAAQKARLDEIEQRERDHE